MVLVSVIPAIDISPVEPVVTSFNVEARIIPSSESDKLKSDDIPKPMDLLLELTVRVKVDDDTTMDDEFDKIISEAVIEMGFVVDVNEASPDVIFDIENEPIPSALLSALNVKGPEPLITV